MELKSKEVISQFNGILPYHEVFYIRSIKFSVRKAISSFQSFWKQLENSNYDHDEIFYELYTALTHAAAVSRYFWPSRNGSLFVARGKKLREAFDIEDTHPLKSRKLRDALEHFDERLDRFLLDDPMGHILDLTISDSRVAESDNGHVFRLIDPERKVAILFGEQYNFQPIQQSIESIYNQAVQMENDGGRLKKVI